MKTIPQRLQEARLAYPLTQEQVAELLGVVATTVSRWESGAGFPGVNSQRRLCEIYKKTHWELFGSELQEAAPFFMPAPDQKWMPAPNQTGEPRQEQTGTYVELQISIPVLLSSVDLLQQLSQHLKVNGQTASAEQVKILQSSDRGGTSESINITARIYVPRS